MSSERMIDVPGMLATSWFGKFLVTTLSCMSDTNAANLRTGQLHETTLEV